MRYPVFVLCAAVFLCATVGTEAKQNSASQSSYPSANSSEVNPSSDCKAGPGARVEMTQIAQRDSPAPVAKASEPAAMQTDDPAPITVNLDQDLKFLSARQSELAKCIPTSDAADQERDPEDACFGGLLLTFEMRHRDGELDRDIPIGRLGANGGFFYESGMTIDADGAPNAYHPDNSGLDDLSNAGTPGTWEGLAKDQHGEPYIQGPDDPFPGYYVSETALADRTKPVSDPTRYVDASKVPFIVLPGGMARQLGARPGDFAVVFNQRNGKSSYAIFGDVGPYDHLGEGSIALAENLGLRSDARNGGARRGIVYVVFPGSGNGRPRPVEEIDAEGQKLLYAWEAVISTTKACVAQASRPATEGTDATR